MDDVSVLLCGTRCLMHALCFLPKDDEFPMNFENEVRDDLWEYVVEHLGDEESGVLIVDETGFLNKGK
jgi:hypothetical protein